MSRILYIDSIGGVAGDMLLAALLDAGADHAAVSAAFERLGVPGLELVVTRTERHGIGANHVGVRSAPEHQHRTWRDVRAVIDAAELPVRAHELAHDAFRRLAEAEGHIHGVPADEVHFHEVGAADSIADVCGVAVALASLDIDRVVSSSLPAARGFVNAAHGRLPLPAPATLELLRGAPVYGVEVEAELVTPTGAALVAAAADTFGSLPRMTLETIGYGAGTRDLAELPNLVRVVIGVAATEAPESEVSLIEANLDDLPAELIPDAAFACAQAGALDVWTTPVHMKKGRPGLVLSALVRPSDERGVAEAMLRSTSTLGVRVTSGHRYELEREWRTVEVDGERIRVKVGLLEGEVVNVAPEHDDCVAVASRSGRPVKAIWQAALAAAQEDAS